MDKEEMTTYNAPEDKSNVVFVALLSIMMGMLIMIAFLTGCTLSLNQMDTHGKSAIEEKQETDPKTDAQATVPVSVLPSSLPIPISIPSATKAP